MTRSPNLHSSRLANNIQNLHTYGQCRFIETALDVDSAILLERCNHHLLLLLLQKSALDCNNCTFLALDRPEVIFRTEALTNSSHFMTHQMPNLT